MALSPDGKYLVVTDTGYREYLTVLSTADGHLVSKHGFGSRERKASDSTPASLYYGLAFAPKAGADGSIPLFASRGPEDRISIFNLTPDGTLADSGRELDDPSRVPKIMGGSFDAGVALDRSGATCYVTHNMTSAFTEQKGSISIIDVATNRVLAKPIVGGYPLAIAGTVEAAGKKKIYVGSERDASVGVVDVRNPEAARSVRAIPTGDHPDALLLDKARKRLFVANAGSDTVSIVDTRSDAVTDTILLRPAAMTVPGATPTGLALSPDQSRLYVTLADLNALAVVALTGGKGRLLGYVPTGWYPTSVVVAPDGKRIFVANAKGVLSRQPNTRRWGPGSAWGNYIENIMEGTVSTFPAPTAAQLKAATRQVLANNRISGNLAHANDGVLKSTGIKHVIYIVKENRTYDQVLGDVKRGNGDPSVCLYPRSVSPNLHAITDRFVLLDNFYVSGEVSADGWCWSTQGMASEYTERNVPFNYSGRGRYYDFEGQNNGSPVDLEGLRDVARSPGGYIWDDCVKSRVAFRNYGFYLAIGVPFGPHGHALVHDNQPTKKALANTTDPSFFRFATEYADSDAWVRYNAPSKAQRRAYGKFGESCRFLEWKREFDQYVKNRNLPPFEMVRFMRDHTEGTALGYNTPSAMVSDNDYAVGELVEAVSKSPYWKDTAIFVIEDDAQTGQDHVDCHRSTCYVISSHIKPGTIDHHFYNTDSVLRTMEAILSMPPMNHYDATAPVFSFIGPSVVNGEQYSAILAPKKIVCAVNDRSAYGERESERMDFSQADRAPEGRLNEILWHDVKGANVPCPPARHGPALADASRRDADE
jgi:YVTN family beta-propeller protein